MTGVDTLTDLLVHLTVLPGSKAGEAADLERTSGNPKTYAEKLLERGWVTSLQARQIGRGRGKHLGVGQYVILDRLGSGGMGRVFRVRHRILGRIAALKLVRLDRRHCPTTRSRFLREVRLVSKLNHENVVHAYDAGHDHNSIYLVMEYVSGPDISRLIVAEGRIEIGRACEYARQAALGLAHIHGQGLVHRDVKPANLGLTQNGATLKVLDVGLARTNHTRETETGMSQAGHLVGSADFAAPEQIIDSRKVDARADIYSLGCSLYNMLAGQLPFPGGTSMRKAIRHLNDRPQAIEELVPNIPPSLAAITRQLMARQRKERVRTAEMAAGLLREFATPVVAAPQSISFDSTSQTAADYPTLTSSS